MVGLDETLKSLSQYYGVFPISSGYDVRQLTSCKYLGVHTDSETHACCQVSVPEFISASISFGDSEVLVSAGVFLMFIEPNSQD